MTCVIEGRERGSDWVFTGSTATDAVARMAEEERRREEKWRRGRNRE